MRLALAQINPTVGDLSGNYRKITSFINRAAETGADLVCFPELALTGYPPEDLLLKPDFLAANREHLEDLAASTKSFDPVVVVGFVDLEEGEVFNAAAVIHRGSLKGIYHKIFLPNYGVFDEKRYFQSGSGGLVFTFASANIGVTICEDIWHPVGPAVLEARQARAQVLLNLSASPYHRGKQQQREKMLSVRASDQIAYLAYVNLVGAQDELVFDGNSMIFDEQGSLIARAAAFREDLLVADLQTERVLRTRFRDLRHRELKTFFGAAGEVQKIFISPPYDKSCPESHQALVNPGRKQAGKWEAPGYAFSEEEEEAEIYEALVLGVKDYVNKNGFARVFVGLSGGIDSSLTAAIAVDALGPERVTGIFMPSPYTSRESREDARRLAANLKINFLEIPIQEIYEAYLAVLGRAFGAPPGDIAAQNLQARIRGNLLMALTNQYGGIVLSTGNKSELSVGYATLYGDMAGGFAVLKDVPKTLVYRLSRYRNRIAGREIIPGRVLEKTPTAELKPGQKDEDDLPPYNVLDQIIEKYVEGDLGPEEITAEGCARGLVQKVIDMIDRSEYKRRQAPPGVKITPRAFGKDRRMPITNRFRETGT
ncbi:MAG: NAD+ synthase [Bacillota bacterium]|nr:NAD+ synthase [Bacillota bacterium]